MDHNTVDADGGAAVYVYGGTKTAPRQVQGFEFTNNAIRHNDYGINGADCAFGTNILTNFFPGSIVQRELAAGRLPDAIPRRETTSADLRSRVRRRRRSDYVPASGGILTGRATDGSNIGANIAALRQRPPEFVVSGAQNGPRAPLNVRITTK